MNFATEYKNKDGINLTYIASNKMSNIIVTDSDINVSSISKTPTKRSALLQECALKLWKNKKILSNMALGMGKITIFPYVKNGKIINDYVTQDRIIVLSTDGERPIDIAVLADLNTIDKVTYGKYKRYTLENSVHIITEFYSNETAQVILGYSKPPQTSWEDKKPIAINNVDRLLFASIDCPIDPRNGEKFYKAKITDGCGSIIADIKSQFTYLANEYDLKKAFVGADEQLFRTNRDGKLSLPDTQLFKIMDTGIDNFFEVFDPAIRADPIFSRLKNTFELLENHIGLSRGIFTSPENVGSYNNQSNIKRSIFDTYAFVTEARDNIRYAVDDYLYACDVLAEYYSLTPQGARNQYTFDISWSSEFIEDSAEEFTQYSELQSRGMMSKAELRQWVKGGSLDDNQVEIDKITATDPASDIDYLGDNEAPIASIENEIENTVAKTLNGAQTQSLINIVLQFQQGVLTEQQAMNIISVSIGISKDEAKELLASV